MAPLLVLLTLEALWGLGQRTPETPASSAASSIPITLQQRSRWDCRSRWPPRSRRFRADTKPAGSSRPVIFALLVLASGTILAGIALSLSRTAFLSTPAAMYVVALLVFTRRLAGWPRWLAGAGIALVGITAVAAMIPFGLVERFARLGDGTAGSRLGLWRDAGRLATDYPMIGVGLGNFYPAILRYHEAPTNVAWTSAHNDYVQILDRGRVWSAPLSWRCFSGRCWPGRFAWPFAAGTGTRACWH